MTSDADGNTLTDNAGRVMSWDSQNRMTSCAYQGTASTFTYGADGFRRSETVTPSGGSAVTTRSVYDGTMLVQEQRGTGAFATYLNGLRGPECRVDETQPAAETGYTSGKTTFQRGPAKWYVYDGLGSVVGEVDPSGNLTSNPKYDVYGLVRSNAGTASSAMGFVGGLGHLSEAGTGLIYMKARYYDPSLGRFCSQDPGASGSNWFVYCNNNPINCVDANGRNPSFATMLAEDWKMLAVSLFFRGFYNMALGPWNIAEGRAAMIMGEAIATAGQAFDGSLLGQLIGSAAEASGLQLQASGANAVRYGVIEMLTGALQVFASQIIFANSEDIGEGSADIMQSAYQMATQHL